MGIAGKDTCKGDGGSPLVCQSKGDPFTYVQAGVVSWGIGCGEDATPGVYASVSKAVCWIDYSMSCHQGRVSGDFSSYWGHSDQCQAWMDGEVGRLNQEVDAAIQNADSLTGRKRAEVLARGAKADSTLHYYSQCTVAWTPDDVDQVSNFARETDSLTAGTGGYSNPHPGPPGGLTAPVTEGPAPHSVPQQAPHSVPQQAPHSAPQQAPESYPDNTNEVEPSSPGTEALSSQVKETV